MKRIVCLSLILVMLFTATGALASPQTIDLDTMSVDELKTLKSEVSAAILNHSVENVDGFLVISDYSEYARNPEAHTGEQIRFDGEVIQVVEGVESNLYRISFKNDSSNVFIVMYTPDSKTDRILEDDKVTVFAEFTGLYTYESTLGGSITVPSCNATAITSVMEEESAYAATRQDPAPIGATITYDGSSYSNPAVTDLTVTRVIRGSAAWDMVRGFNRYNDKPESGQEYIVVYLHAKAISSQGDAQAELDDYDFSFASESGTEYSKPYTSGITPELTNLYPGAEHEGILVALVNKEDKPSMIYLKTSDKPIWFDLNNSLPIELPEDLVLTPLQKGDNNDDVKQMQGMLVEMGFLAGTPDGAFGAKTEEAIKSYQEALGIEATGIADEATLRLILTKTTAQ